MFFEVDAELLALRELANKVEEYIQEDASSQDLLDQLVKVREIQHGRIGN